MSTIINGIQSISQIQEIQTLFKLILIVFLSGFVGFERASWNKPAGFRTHVLVGISAVLVMICGEYLYNKTGADPTRIPAQFLSGIGFLGAVTILREGFNVRGLTTAAGLLAVTCIGLAVGEGYYLGAIIATSVVYAVLSYSHLLSDKLEHFNYLDLEILLDNPKEVIKDIKQIFTENDLELVKLKIDKEKNSNCLRVMAKYKEINMNEIISNIMEIEKVKEVVEVKEK